MQLKKSTGLLAVATFAVGLGMGCGENESAQERVERAGDAVQEEFDQAVQAAREGAAAEAARAIARATEEATDAAQKDGALAATEEKTREVLDQVEKNIERSIAEAQDGYAKARKEGANPLEAAGDAYDAVDGPQDGN
jgi:hypothetical protein